MRARLRDRRGIIIVYVALAIFVICGFGALAVDVGHLYNVKNQLQAAADAAALAGASALDGMNNVAQAACRDQCQRIGGMNYADVAYGAVPAFGSWSPGCAEGDPIPVALQRNDGNAAGGDIVVGNWDGTTFTPANGSVEINAVRVVARRTGTIAAQPRPQNWFAKVLTLIGGGDYAFQALEAEAIAAKEQDTGFVPVAVNEYWDNPYPNSYMRETNIDGSTGWGGQTFAVLGAAADANTTGNDMNSFVDVLQRTDEHDGTGTWYQLGPSADGDCSPTCLYDFIQMSTPPTTANPAKFDENFQYLFEGIPETVILPTCVQEVYNAGYPDTNTYTIGNGNDPSECPFASLFYFSSSGTVVTKKLNLEQSVYDGMRFYERYPAGSRLLVFVYDGSYIGTNEPVTVIGYGIIEIDGYNSGSNIFPLGASGNTAYGHAVKHGITGAADGYLIQPADLGAASPCDLNDSIRNYANSLSAAKLVGDLNY